MDPDPGHEHFLKITDFLREDEFSNSFFCNYFVF